MPRRPVHTWIDVRAGERRTLAWSFLYFFCLLGGYYLLRPVRDALAVADSRTHMPWMFAGTFLGMLLAMPAFGALVARYPRRRFVPLVYRFFLLHLVCFAALLHLDVGRVALSYVFYSWLSVYNMFVVSVFWSVMVDVFRNEQGKRLFGIIAAGGSLGGLTGAWVTSALAETLGLTALLLLACVLLEAAVQCFFRVIDASGAPGASGASGASPPAEAPAHGPGQPEAPAAGDRRAIGGGVLAGIVAVARSPYLAGICMYVMFMATVQTFLYIGRADIVRGAFATSEARAAFFGHVDLLSNLGTMTLQLLVTARVLRWLGVGVALAALPVSAGVGVGGLAMAPVLSVLVACEVVLRAGNHAMGRPAREVLFTVVSREQKYKSKSFIDTLVFRLGDLVASWGERGLHALGLGLAGVALVTVPLAGMWLGCGLLLGRAHEARARRAVAAAAAAAAAPAAAAPPAAAAHAASPDTRSGP